MYEFFIFFQKISTPTAGLHYYTIRYTINVDRTTFRIPWFVAARTSTVNFVRELGVGEDESKNTYAIAETRARRVWD
jgi:hypothetical protein